MQNVRNEKVRWGIRIAWLSTELPFVYVVNQETGGAQSTISARNGVNGYSLSNQSAARTDRSPPDMNPAKKRVLTSRSSCLLL
jgi:hypothetical protein